MNFHDGVAARTIWGESRGEGPTGKLAVAHVIRNRLKDGRWGTTPAAVCMAPSQFSCWLTSDPNRRKMLELDEATDVDLAKCIYAWNASETDIDLTMGSTHYQVVGTNAYWSHGKAPTVTIGRHEFFSGLK